MDMKNWVKMLNGDMSGLDKPIKTVEIPKGKIYSIKWANGQTTPLMNHDETVQKINEWINKHGWEWARITNTKTKKRQIIRESKSLLNRGFLQIKKLNENMLMNEEKFELGFGHLGNGISVWNRKKEEHGDYQKVAHIDRNRKIIWYIKNLPNNIKKEIEDFAKNENPSVSTTQSDKVFKKR